jgi:hypothetical protein
MMPFGMSFSISCFSFWLDWILCVSTTLRIEDDLSRVLIKIILDDYR